ncbi:MAG: hypothetical protein MI920_27515 [Kiloniellales bacterium]|nr:hypothetical protein [Kiloniellales bacterium]
MGSPIDSFEGATAIFTGAHSSVSLIVCFLLALAVCIAPIIQTTLHENEKYKEHAD